MMDAHDIRPGKTYWALDDGEHFKVIVLRAALKAKDHWFCQNEHGLGLLLATAAFQAPAKPSKKERASQASTKRTGASKNGT